MTMTYEQFNALDTIEQLRIVGDALTQTANPATVFGPDADEKIAKRRWRNLSKFVHPDVRGGTEDDDLAGIASKRLNLLWETAKKSFANGTYGKSVVETDTEIVTGTFTVKDGEYRVVRFLRTGDVGDYYLLHDDGSYEVIMHIARDSSDNDLIANEARILSAINSHDVFNEMEGYRYIPQLITAFYTTGGLAVNLWRIPNWGEDAMLPSFNNMHSLSEIIDVIGADSINIKHLGWIWRRILSALAVSSYIGVIHAGITPDSIWISTAPNNHGAILVNWVHASHGQQPVKSLSTRWEDLYPKEILMKDLPQLSSDTYMAAMSMMWAFSGLVPDPTGDGLARYFYVMTLQSAQSRLSDIKDIGSKFEEAIFGEMGWKKEFVALDYKAQPVISWEWWWK